MPETIIEAFQVYYGLDWVAFFCGLLGMYLISEKNRWGFLVNFIACCAAFYIAFVSMQMGFVMYNFVLVFLMIRGFRNWNDEIEIKEEHEERPIGLQHNA